MNIHRIKEIINDIKNTRILVIGDFFLDQYLDMDRRLEETSIETGLPAHQVTSTRNSPGAAGNVAANLTSLDVNTIALTVLGDDGNGYELSRELEHRHISSEGIIKSPLRVTPTYTKPMMHEPDGRIHELSRLDIKNRSETPISIQDAIVVKVEELVSLMDGIIIADQVEETNYGVVTDRVREQLVELAEKYPQKTFVADSRCRIGDYANISLKPNDREAAAAVGMERGELDDEQSSLAGMQLHKKCKSAVYLTRGHRGIDVFENETRHRVPAVHVEGPIDIVGAGDSTIAGLTAALCAGATPQEAALIGCLTASITVRCIGSTGTATRQQLLCALETWQAQHT